MIPPVMYLIPLGYHPIWHPAPTHKVKDYIAAGGPRLSLDRPTFVFHFRLQKQKSARRKRRFSKSPAFGTFRLQKNIRPTPAREQNRLSRLGFWKTARLQRKIASLTRKRACCVGSRQARLIDVHRERTLTIHHRPRRHLSAAAVGLTHQGFDLVCRRYYIGGGYISGYLSNVLQPSAPGEHRLHPIKIAPKKQKKSALHKAPK